MRLGGSSGTTLCYCEQSLRYVCTIAAGIVVMECSSGSGGGSSSSSSSSSLGILADTAAAAELRPGSGGESGVEDLHRDGTAARA